MMMLATVIHRTSTVLFCLCLARLSTLPACGQEESPIPRLYDTGAASAAPLAAEALARRAGWRSVAEDTVEHRFSGDAALLNDKLAVVLRREGRGAEVYSQAAAGWKHRSTFGHVGLASSGNAHLDSLEIIENSSGAVVLQANFRKSEPAPLRFRITTGEAILEIRAAGGVGSVDMQTKVRHLVVPDYFGDDMVFGPEDLRGLDLPAENFCLHLIDGGDAIVMAVWESSEQDVWVTAANAGNEGDFCSSRIRCLQDKSLWIAFLESPGIWHAESMVEVPSAKGPSASDVLAKGGWKPPFPAKWRCSLVRDGGVSDSWDLEARPLPEQAGVEHHGPLVVYPVDRSRDTPLTVSCPTDVLRNTLGVGPCQYILAVEGLAADENLTPASVMEWVEKQFERKKTVAAAADIAERLEQMAEHVSHARAKIQKYAEFSGQVRKLLAGKEGGGQIRTIVDDLDKFAAAGLAPGVSPERVRQLAADVRALIGKGDSLAACRALGDQARSLGAVQDGALARCRMAVRRLRQQGRTMGDARPQDAGKLQDVDLAREVRRLAEGMLQKGASHGDSETRSKQERD